MIERLDELRLFAHVAETGSLSAAARVLGLPVNTASRKLASLESRLGVRLAERTTRSLGLTDEGERFLPRCLAVLDAVDEAEAELAEGDRLRGTLKLGVPTQMARFGLLEAIHRTLADAPELSVQLRVSDAPLDPVAEGLDLVVRVAPLTESGLVAVHVGSLEGRLAAAPVYRDTYGLPRRLRELSSHRVLGFLADRSQTEWRLLDARGREQAVPVRPILESDDSRILSDALRAGLGIGFVFGDEPSGELLPVLPSYRMQVARIFALFAPSRRRSPRVRLAVAMLRDMLAGRGGAA